LAGYNGFGAPGDFHRLAASLKPVSAALGPVRFIERRAHYSCQSSMSEDVKRMADLLKSGATMLSDVCPVCGTPLFKVKGEVFCAKCNKPVVYQKAMSPQATLSPGYLLDSVEMTIVGKISEANEVLKIEKDPEKLSLYSNLVFGWLSMLEKLRGLKDSFKE